MALTFKNIQDLILAEMDLDDSESRDNIKTYINMAANEIWHRHLWPERIKTAYISTVAPYATGTVSITQGDTTVTGSGTTFTSAMTGRWFAKDIQSPAYQLTYTNATEIELSTAYVSDSLSGDTYIIYEDTFSLDSACEHLDRVWLEDDGRTYEMVRISQAEADTVSATPRRQDRPSVYTVIEPDSSGNMQIRTHPICPDDEYRIKYRYLTAYTDMTADGDECVLRNSRRDLVYQLALSLALKRDHYRRAQAERAQFEVDLMRAIAAEGSQEVTPRTHLSTRRNLYSRGSGLRWSDLEIS